MNDNQGQNENAPRPPLHATTTLLLTFGLVGQQVADALHEDVNVIAANEDEATAARDAREADLRADLARAHERIDFEVRQVAALELRLAALEQRLGGAPVQPAPVEPAPVLDVIHLPTPTGYRWEVRASDAPTLPNDVQTLASTPLSPVPRATDGQKYVLCIEVAAG